MRLSCTHDLCVQPIVVYRDGVAWCGARHRMEATPFTLLARTWTRNARAISAAISGMSVSAAMAAAAAREFARAIAAVQD